MEEVMLTTFDNPYSPFDEYEKWEEFDMLERNYNTNEYLARIESMLEHSLNIDEEEAFSLAIDEIERLNVLGIYMKITRKEAENLKKQRNSRENH